MIHKLITRPLSNEIALYISFFAACYVASNTNKRCAYSYLFALVLFLILYLTCNKIINLKNCES